MSRLRAIAGGALIFLRPRLEHWQAGAEWTLLVMAAFIGLIGGLGAIAFHYVIELIGNGAMRIAVWWGHLDPSAAAEGFAAFPPWLKIAVPVAGAALVGPILRYWAPDARGHGVPEVMDAVARRGGVIRGRVAFVKILTSALSIGTGSSLGPEGPIAQIGATFGSVSGQVLGIDEERMRYLVACGVAAGIAASFNAPIAGMFFAMEIILADFALTALSGLAIASVVATVVARSVLGATSAFVAPPDFVLNSPWEMGVYAVLGVVAGFVAVTYKKLLYATEDVFGAMKKVPDWARPAIGAAVVGAIGIGVPQVFGVGYDVIDRIFRAEFAPGILLVIVVAKMAATCLSLGSGSSGGVFAPSLVMGSALGGAIGLFAARWLPFVQFAPSGTYAVVGMAAVVAAATHAPLTAMLIVFEMTNGYAIILPLMIACALATVFARVISRESIYTLKLARSGIVIASSREEAVLARVRVNDVMQTDFVTIPRNLSFQGVIDAVLASRHAEIYVTDADGCLAGRINIHLIKSVMAETGLDQLVLAQDVMLPASANATPEMTLAECVRMSSLRSQEQLPVVAGADDPRLVGVLPRTVILDTYNRELLRQSSGGLRVIQHTANGDLFSALEFGEGYETREIVVTARLAGRTLAQIGLRARWGIHCLARRSAHQTGLSEGGVPDADEPLSVGDILVCAGSSVQFDEFSRELEKS
ncbi:MAG: chloride channel protein [Deltaproteobacteria bacterium]|nr:chloride channel protein [Deltaproteobacteria bacterium]